MSRTEICLTTLFIGAFILMSIIMYFKLHSRRLDRQVERQEVRRVVDGIHEEKSRLKNNIERIKRNPDPLRALAEAIREKNGHC